MSSLKDMKWWINQSSWRWQDALTAEQSSLFSVIHWPAAGSAEARRPGTPSFIQVSNQRRTTWSKAAITQNPSGHRWSHLFVRAAGRHVKLCRWMTHTDFKICNHSFHQMFKPYSVLICSHQLFACQSLRLLPQSFSEERPLFFTQNAKEASVDRDHTAAPSCWQNIQLLCFRKRIWQIVCTELKRRQKVNIRRTDKVKQPIWDPISFCYHSVLSSLILL